VKEYETVIGIEFHVQLKTRTKLFCSCRNSFGDDPNVHVCPVCLGLPGALPVLNEEAVRLALIVALALRARIHRSSEFHRKNYFYPDLPKGYQITQYARSLAVDGTLNFGEDETIRIERINIEEEAAKTTHTAEGDALLDFNRSGIPLLEIVTRPDLRGPRDARLFAETLEQLLEYLNVSDCDMEKGQLRADSNLSLRPRGKRALGTKVELKNLNSFRAMEDALEYEVKRQTQVLQSKERVVQETRLWDEDREITRPMRSKEEAHDYRYFPDPDLLPLVLDENSFEAARAGLPELPQEKRDRFVAEYGIPQGLAQVLTDERPLADYFEKLASLVPNRSLAANWVANEVMEALNELNVEIEDFRVSPEALSELLIRLADETITRHVAREVFDRMVETGERPESIIEREGLSQVKDESVLSRTIQEVIQEHPEEVKRYREGKKGLLDFLIGEAMKRTKGRADPERLARLFRKHLMS
jgi:aspartyl-tRNA(Asn)/glutamyl-tRNA(Gln) amidotransferase subunit B